MDLEVLAAMGSRENWDKYSRFIRLTSLTEESATIFQAVGEWYKANPSVEEISWKGFSAWYTLVRHAKMDKDKLGLHKTLLLKLERKEIAEADISPLLEGLTRRDFASQIADVALRVADGDSRVEFAEVEKLLDQYNKLTGKHNSLEKDLGDFSLDRLSQIAEPGFKWRLDALNLGAGDLRKGNLVVFGKRPDAGGTTFLAAESTYMAEQMDFDQEVLWFNNEQEGDVVRSRIVQSALGWSTEDMDNHLPQALEEYTALMGGNRRKIQVLDRPRIHIRDVEWMLKRHNPGLIVFDQLWKVKGFEGEQEVERQTLLANWAREISKEYAPVIAVHQLGGDAENVMYPSMDMLYGSKTGIQGEADLIITLGRKADKGDTRGLHLPKNKMRTPGDRSKRNGRWEIMINADIGRFEE